METLLLKVSVLQEFANLFSNIGETKWQMVLMWAVGGLLIYLAIAKQMEPTLLLPMGFGTILVNLPWSGAITQPGAEAGPISVLYNAGIANELFPLLLFIGIGAMIDFGPLLKNPWLMLFGAAAQFGIFFTFFVASFFFDVNDAASIAIIGAADGPTSIFVANELGSKYIGAIMVAAYSYMALVPIVQPPVIKAVTSKKERLIRMKYNPGDVSKTTKILFPIVVTVIAGLVAPKSVALVGFLMFGNLIRECGVLNNLSETAQNSFANIITILLGITVAGQMHYKEFVQPATLLILGLGLVAFVFDTVGGVVGKLEQVAQHQRNGKFDQQRRNGTAGHVLGHEKRPSFLLIEAAAYTMLARPLKIASAARLLQLASSWAAACRAAPALTEAGMASVRSTCWAARWASRLATAETLSTT